MPNRSRARAFGASRLHIQAPNFVAAQSPAISCTMAIFFDKVPREIRDKIYHLLLVDEANAIELKRAKACINLQPTILRTCKQAYEEAMPMMYEKNTFLFKSWAATGLGPCQYGKSSLHNCDPLKANFRRIKHVSCLCPNEGSEAHHPYVLISSNYIIPETHPLMTSITIPTKRPIR